MYKAKLHFQLAQALTLAVFIVSVSCSSARRSSVQRVDVAAAAYAPSSNARTLDSLNESFYDFSHNTQTLSKLDSNLNTLKAKQLVPQNLTLAEIVPKVENQVNLRNVIDSIFDPNNGGCPLPEKVLKQLNKDKGNSNWPPRVLVEQLTELPKVALPIRGRALSTVIHKVEVLHTNGSTSETLITNTPSFHSLNVGYFVNGTENNFVYTLDCSGFLNAAIEASATLPGADLKAKAGNAIDKAFSLFVGGATIYSPFYIAYVGNSRSNNPMSKEDRIDILNAILENPEISETDTIIFRNSYQVIWTSKHGKESFNGKGSFSAGGGGGVGFANVAASSTGGGSIARSSSFSTFNTFLMSTQSLVKPLKATTPQIKAVIDKLSAK